MLMGLIGRGDDNKRRAILNTIGPVWDGNEVWLLTAGGDVRRLLAAGTRRCSPPSTYRCC